MPLEIAATSTGLKGADPLHDPLRMPRADQGSRFRPEKQVKGSRKPFSNQDRRVMCRYRTDGQAAWATSMLANSPNSQAGITRVDERLPDLRHARPRPPTLAGTEVLKAA
jgi:hypothetical protein